MLGRSETISAALARNAARSTTWIWAARQVEVGLPEGFRSMERVRLRPSTLEYVSSLNFVRSSRETCRQWRETRCFNRRPRPPHKTVHV